MLDANVSCTFLQSKERYRYCSCWSGTGKQVARQQLSINVTTVSLINPGENQAVRDTDNFSIYGHLKPPILLVLIEHTHTRSHTRGVLIYHCLLEAAFSPFPPDFQGTLHLSCWRPGPTV